MNRVQLIVPLKEGVLKMDINNVYETIADNMTIEISVIDVRFWNELHNIKMDIFYAAAELDGNECTDEFCPQGEDFICITFKNNIYFEYLRDKIMDICNPYIRMGCIEYISCIYENDNSTHRIHERLYTNSKMDKIIRERVEAAQNAISYLFPYVNSNTLDMLIEMCENLNDVKYNLTI